MNKTDNNNLVLLKSKIDKLENVHHIKIGAILKHHNQTLNVAGDSIIVNLTILPEDVIAEITAYVCFVIEQEVKLNQVELESEHLKQQIIKQDDN